MDHPSLCLAVRARKNCAEAWPSGKKGKLCFPKWHSKGYSAPTLPLTEQGHLCRGVEPRCTWLLGLFITRILPNLGGWCQHLHFTSMEPEAR